MKLKLALAAVLIVLAPTGAFADDAAIKKGKKVFKKCKACHVIDKEKNKVGPHLVGIIGREAASVASYTKYSKALKAKAKEIGKWDAEKVMAFVENPKKYLGGKSKMTFKLKKEKQRKNLVAYLESLAKK